MWVRAGIALVDATRNCDLIFRGMVVSIKPPVPTAPGQATYPSVVIRITEVLKGLADGKEIVVSVTVRNVPGQIHEIAPEVGNDYIFFLQRGSVLKCCRRTR